ncbi:MAG: AsmA family protein [Ramlibacter sp.]|nr:AsmA family protein [Ramlibacter sp.]
MSTNDTTLIAPRHQPLWVKLLAGLVVFLVLVALLLAFFPWDVLRGPLNRYVSERTGRHFEITRKLDVKLGRTTRVFADGVEFANPDWAHDKNLVTAESAEVQIELLPLLRRRIELPLIELHKPVLGLQVEPDGRKSWSLGKDDSDPRNIPNIGALVVDNGSARIIASGHGADIQTDFAIDAATSEGAQQMPLTFKAKGTWKNEPFTASGRTGNVLYLDKELRAPFPVRVKAVAGGTMLDANGAVSSIATFDGADVNFDLRGRDLSTLYKLLGVVLPATPRYALKGHLVRQGEVWHATGLNGKLGNTDLAGDLDFDRTNDVPHLSGKLSSKSLDFDDLAPIVGLPEQPRSAAAMPDVAPGVAKERVVHDTGHKVLPTAQIDLARLKAMTADVHYTAVRIVNARGLPLDRMTVQVKLGDGVLKLDPVNLGVASGTLAGAITVNGNSNPAIAEVHLDARALELNKLFPRLKITQASFGKMHGDIDLKGRGNSVAKMLGSSSGNVSMLMGRGQISNLLLEFAGLDGGEIIKFLIRGDKNVVLRCGAASFDVKDGLMTSRAFVFDTDDTIIYGGGTISLANESLDLALRPYPKDMSILALRSPLKLAGTFDAPKAGVDKGALASRAGTALILGAINPLLALAATVETGPGKDANCREVLRGAASTDMQARVAIMAREGDSKAMGAPGSPGAQEKPTFWQRVFGPRKAASTPAATQ